MNLYEIIKKPILTEKSQALAAAGKYVFKVAKEATKGQIARAVETVYKGTKVGRVAIVKKAKEKVFWRRGRKKEEGNRPAIKKAIVTLKEGKIEVFSAKGGEKKDAT